MSGKFTRSRTFVGIATAAIAFQSLLLFIALFQPAIDYRIAASPAAAGSPAEFERLLETITDARIQRGNRVEVLTNGPAFYEAELAAIREARRTINLEAYIFSKGEVTRRVLQALAERARAGVQVKLLLDSMGSFSTTRSYLAPLLDAGGRVEWYHPIRWYSLPRINNRTHRELIIVDGRIGFIGGAGFADHWLKGDAKNPMWRDTMVRVEGEAVSALQSAFLENWLEVSGEILTGDEHFPFVRSPREALTRTAEQASPAHAPASAPIAAPEATPRTQTGSTSALVIKSSPLAGASTHSRILFQMLLAAARKTIWVSTPYFLPDRGLRAEFVRAVRERGVDVRVITPGGHNDHLLTRRSSRRLYGELLEAGVKIYEYEPAMIHAKVLIVDGQWSVVGSSNLDNRSFGLNDEVNMAASDPELAARLAQDFSRDLLASRSISFEEWRRRPFYERVHEFFGKILERQQ